MHPSKAGKKPLHVVPQNVPNDVETLIALLRSEFPKIKIGTDAPLHPKGQWMIDLSLDAVFQTCSWQQGIGFGLFTSPDQGFGDKPDEIFRDSAVAARRLVKLLSTARLSSTPSAMWLRELRQLAEIPQTALALKLGKEQAAISRLEKGGDVKLSTLDSYVKAIGGTLHLSVRFKDFEAEISASGLKPKT